MWCGALRCVEIAEREREADRAKRKLRTAFANGARFINRNSVASSGFSNRHAVSAKLAAAK